MLARMTGRGTGKLVAMLNVARDQFTKATKDTKLGQVKWPEVLWGRLNLSG